MIFQHTWSKIPTGEKTETSRIAQDSDQFTILGAWSNNGITPSVPMSIAHLNLNHSVHSVVRNGRTLSRVGQVLSVQPARTKPTVWWQNTNPLKPFVVEDVRQFCLEHKSVNSKDDNETWLKANGYRPLQIRITRIQLVDVRQMTLETAQREGFASVAEFWKTWCEMHDQYTRKVIGYFFMFGETIWKDGICVQEGFRVEHHQGEKVFYSYTLADYLKTRPAERYRAWSLQFEVIR